MTIPAPHSTQLTGWPWTQATNPAIYTSQTNWPKISIITPSYNQGIYLEQTIRSVLLQHYPNLEYIIIDAASTDDSVSIIKKYSEHLHYWVSERDNGQSGALNKGFAKATGEIFAWINSDDFYEQDALFKIASIYKQTGFSFFCGSCTMIDQADNFIQKLYTPAITSATLIQYWKPHFCPPQPSIFFTREAFKQLGNFNETLRYTMDYALWLKASKKYSFHIVDENISYYRVHQHSKTGSSNGLRKFIPEWKRLIAESLKQEPAFTRRKYYMQERLFLLRRYLKRITSIQHVKNKTHQWLARNPGSA